MQLTLYDSKEERSTCANRFLYAGFCCCSLLPLLPRTLARKHFPALNSLASSVPRFTNLLAITARTPVTTSLHFFFIPVRLVRATRWSTSCSCPRIRPHCLNRTELAGLSIFNYVLPFGSVWPSAMTSQPRIQEARPSVRISSAHQIAT